MYISPKKAATSSCEWMTSGAACAGTSLGAGPPERGGAKTARTARRGTARITLILRLRKTPRNAKTRNRNNKKAPRSEPGSLLFLPLPSRILFRFQQGSARSEKHRGIEPGPRERKPLSAVVAWNKFGDLYQTEGI